MQFFEMYSQIFFSVLQSQKKKKTNNDNKAM